MGHHVILEINFHRGHFVQQLYMVLVKLQFMVEILSAQNLNELVYCAFVSCQVVPPVQRQEILLDLPAVSITLVGMGTAFGKDFKR